MAKENIPDGGKTWLSCNSRDRTSDQWFAGEKEAEAKKHGTSPAWLIALITLLKPEIRRMRLFLCQYLQSFCRGDSAEAMDSREIR